MQTKNIFLGYILFFYEKELIFRPFSAFYGQRLVTAAKATPSPWSIFILFWVVGWLRIENEATQFNCYCNCLLELSLAIFLSQIILSYLKDEFAKHISIIWYFILTIFLEKRNIPGKIYLNRRFSFQLKTDFAKTIIMSCCFGFWFWFWLLILEERKSILQPTQLSAGVRQYSWAKQNDKYSRD